MTPLEKSLHNRWRSMIDRCTKPNHKWWPRYGGRGIQVCAEWREDFMNYARDVGLPPDPAFDLDRIDNDGNYEPGNVRWVPTRINMRNNSRNVPVTINGVTKLCCEWAEEIGISRAAFTYRVQRGWTGQELLMAPQQKVKSTTINGVTKTNMQWCREIGITIVGFNARLRAGLTGEELLRPSQKSNHPPANPST